MQESDDKNLQEFLCEFCGYEQRLGQASIKAKDIGEAYVKARQIARITRGVNWIRHGRGVYNT